MTDSPEITNAECTARIGKTLARYNDEYDIAANLIDLLAHSRHWCDEHGLAFHVLDRTARQHYLAELETDTDHASSIPLQRQADE